MLYTYTHTFTHTHIDIPEVNTQQHTDYFPQFLLQQTHLLLVVGTILGSANVLSNSRSVAINTLTRNKSKQIWLLHKCMNGWLITAAMKSPQLCFVIGLKWTSKKKGKRCTSPLRAQARCICPSSSERVVVGEFVFMGWVHEKMSLGCIVSHLENHLPTSPCSCSLSPPLAHPIHSHTNTHARTQGTLHSQTSFILSNCPNAQQLYTQTHNPQCKCKIYCNLSIKN